MFSRKREVTVNPDVNYYTARRLGDMAQSLSRLARAFDDEIESQGQLTRDDGLSALQASAALVCEDCSKCNLYADSEKEDSYYLYYLLRAFEQKGRIDFEDMPQMFQNRCRKREAYLGQLNRNLGRATMNLSWKNRFLESRDAVVSQFRELSVILEEFSHQIDQAADISEEYDYILKRQFRRYHMTVGRLLMLRYENGQKEAFLTVKTNNGRCVTTRDAAELMSSVMKGTRWSPAKDSRSIITRQYGTVRFLEDGGYRLLFGASRIPRQGEKCSGDNYTFCESQGSQVVMSLSDGMGCGETAFKESKQVVELTEQLLETGFSARAALKLVNTVLLLAGAEQHPATLDVSCIDLHTGGSGGHEAGSGSHLYSGRRGGGDTGGGGGASRRDEWRGAGADVQETLGRQPDCDGDRRSAGRLPGDNKEQVMKEFLESLEEMTPQELADRILEFAVSCIPAPRDDMTALAAGLWRRRS